MARYGYTLKCELHDPKELVRQAVAAEDAGFDFLVISDHFTLGLGAGERLNEHVVGRGWPAVDVRHEMLEESVDIIRALWDGGYVTHRGTHLMVEDACIFDLPSTPPGFFLAASGHESAALAARAGGGICLTAPDREVVDAFVAAGGKADAVWGQQPLVWSGDTDGALEVARERFRFGVPGWKVQAELPNPVNVDAATATVTADAMADSVLAGASADAVIGGLKEWTDAGITEMAVVQVGDDVDGFLRAWTDEIRPGLL